MAALLVVVVLTTLVVVAEQPAAAAADLVVAPWGTSRATGTAEDPFGAVADALTAAQPGDRVRIRAGVYDEDVLLDVDAEPGSAGVVVESWPGERPVLRGRLWLRRPSGWTIRGLEITWRDGLAPDMHLVKITGGAGWTLEDLHIHDVRSYAAVLVAGTDAHPTEPAGWALRDSCIRDTHATNEVNQDHLVYVNSGLQSGGGTIADNVLVGAPNGNGVKLGGPTPDSGGAAGVVVSGNVIGRVTQGVLIAGGSLDNVVEGNRFGPVPAPYAAIRSFALDNDSNVASGNTTYGSDLLLAFASPLGAVVDGGGNQHRPAEEWTTPDCGPAADPAILPYQGRRAGR